MYRVVLDEGGSGPRSNGYAAVAKRPKTKPKDGGEGGKDGEDPEQSKLRAGLNSEIIREKPNIKWTDVAGLESAKQALQEAVILPVNFPRCFTEKRRPWQVDKFFEAIGVNVQNGYGLTETSPVVAARRLSCNVLGSVGNPTKDTEFKIVDHETGNVLPPGSKGIVKVRVPPVMKGYYKNPVATKQVIDEDGWLNTGDMGWISPHHSTGRSRCCGGVIVLEGHAKDTIVLSTVNVEKETKAKLQDISKQSFL